MPIEYYNNQLISVYLARILYRMLRNGTCAYQLVLELFIYDYTQLFFGSNTLFFDKQIKM